MYLQILAWNCQSLKPKIPELLQLIYKNKYNIILLSETWCNEHTCINIPNFNIYRNDRISNSRSPHGGVAILVHSSIEHSILKVSHLKIVEGIFVKIQLTGSTITIGSIYSIPSIPIKQFKSEFSNLLSTPGPIVIAGDFNAKHQLWNNIKNCKKGVELEKLCNHNSFTVHCSNEPTLFPCRGLPSIVDIVISKRVHGISQPIALNELSSDHLPISFKIPANFNIPIPTKILNYQKADWEIFREIIAFETAQYETTNLNTPVLIDEAIDNVIHIIHKATISAIPFKNPHLFRYPFSDELKMLTKNRNLYRKLYQNTLNLAFKSMTNQLNRLIKSKTQQLNQKAWDEKLSKLNIFDESLYIFTKNIKNKKKSMPPLKLPSPSTDLAYSNKNKANLLAQSFYTSHTISIDAPSSYTMQVSQSIDSINNETFVVERESLTTDREILFIVKKLKIKKANGFDNISNKIIKKLPIMLIQTLRNIFNSCFRIAYFPLAWKTGKVIAIPKPGKDPTLPISYRPITLH